MQSWLRIMLEPISCLSLHACLQRHLKLCLTAASRIARQQKSEQRGRCQELPAVLTLTTSRGLTTRAEAQEAPPAAMSF